MCIRDRAIKTKMSFQLKRFFGKSNQSISKFLIKNKLPITIIPMAQIKEDVFLCVFIIVFVFFFKTIGIEACLLYPSRCV